MDFKKQLILLCLSDLVLSEALIGREIDISSVSDMTTWQSANFNCSMKYSSLLKIENSVIMHGIEDELNKQDGTIFWVGGKETRGEWIWSQENSPLLQSSIGCFSGDLSHHVYTNFSNNQPELCAGFCKSMMKRSYAVLQGEKCYCLYDTTTFSKERPDTCNTPCPGNTKAVCGGANTVTFYSTNDVVNWGLNEPSRLGLGKDCAYIMKSKENRSIWYSGDCKQTYHYICKLDNEDICSWMNLPDPCLYPLPEAKTWNQASRKCQLMGGYLAERELLVENDFDLIGNHWTGLTRKKQEWRDGSRVDFKLKRFDSYFDLDHLCIALQYREDDGWGLISLPCNKSLRYICISAVPAEQKVLSSDKADAAREAKSLDQEDINMRYIVIPTLSCAAFLLLFTVCAFMIYKRRRRVDVDREPEEHFYFILEKQDTRYSKIHIDLDEGKNKTSRCDVYNNLVFNGTVKQSLSDSLALSAKDLNTGSRTDSSHNYDKVSIQNRLYDTVFSVRQCTFSVEGNYDKVLVSHILLNNNDDTWTTRGNQNQPTEYTGDNCM